MRLKTQNLLILPSIASIIKIKIKTQLKQSCSFQCKSNTENKSTKLSLFFLSFLRNLPAKEHLNLSKCSNCLPLVDTENRSIFYAGSYFCTPFSQKPYILLEVAPETSSISPLGFQFQNPYFRFFYVVSYNFPKL